jgi:hypothetical protein
MPRDKPTIWQEMTANSFGLRAHQRIRDAVPHRYRPLMKSLYFRAHSKSGRRKIVAKWLRDQAQWCHREGSSLYAKLLVDAAGDVEAGGPSWEVLETFEPGPAPCDALGFKFMGSVHRLVLEGRAPALAPYYPSVDGDVGDGDPWPAFRDTVAEHGDVLRQLLQLPVQTNEVGRCRALIGGFLTVARETNLPLRIMEIGASAGLNLRWDRYRYENGDDTWGDPASPVRLVDGFIEGRPELDIAAQIAERSGCDVAPLDPGNDDDKMTLMAYTWADQIERFNLLRGALEIARSAPLSVEQADATDWLGSRLEASAPGLATVIFHSYVTQYFQHQAREKFNRLIDEAGKRASSEAPLAWLRLERGRRGGEVRLTRWPGWIEEILATSDPYGRDVRWSPRKV